jgi:hypothetical protein
MSSDMKATAMWMLVPGLLTLSACLERDPFPDYDDDTVAPPPALEPPVIDGMLVRGGDATFFIAHGGSDLWKTHGELSLEDPLVALAPTSNATIAKGARVGTTTVTATNDGMELRRTVSIVPVTAVTLTPQNVRTASQDLVWAPGATASIALLGELAGAEVHLVDASLEGSIGNPLDWDRLQFQLPVGVHSLELRADSFGARQHEITIGDRVERISVERVDDKACFHAYAAEREVVGTFELSINGEPTSYGAPYNCMPFVPGSLVRVVIRNTNADFEVTL